jgi:putative ABC transport system permease protein
VRRLAFWLRWSARDLRRRWVAVTAIALTVALGTGAYTGLHSLERWRTLSNDESFALLHTHDLHVSLTAGSYVPSGSLAALARVDPAVASADERLIVPTQVDASGAGKTIFVPGRLVGSPVGGTGSRVDAVWAMQGRTLRPSDAGRAVAVLDRSFGQAQDLPAAGMLRVAGGHELPYVGQGASPEYFRLTTDVAMLRGRGAFAVLFVPLAAAQELSGHAGRVNDLVLMLQAGADRPATLRRLESALAARFPDVGYTTETKEEIDAHRVLYKDASGDQIIFDAFAYLLLAAATFATFNLASRIVESQRREIGIGMALGAPPRVNAIRPLLLGAEIAVLGVLLGIPIGLWIGRVFMSVMQEAVPLPVWRSPFEPATFAVGAALGLALPLVATAIPVWRAVRMRPVEAIETRYRLVRGSGLAPVVQLLRLPGRSFARIPVRNVLRTPRRTLLTVLGIAAAITALTAALGLVDSFRATIDDSRAAALSQSPTRFTADLAGFLPRDELPVGAARLGRLVAQAEPSLQLSATVRAGRESIDLLLELQDASSGIWRPRLTAGAFSPGSAGIVLTEKAGRDLGVGVGDWVVLRHPYRTGPAAFRTVERRLQIAGLTPNPFRVFAYMDASQAGRFGLAGLTNLVNLVPREGVSEDTVKRALFSLPGVVSAQPVAATSESFEDAIAQIVDVVYFTGLVALALALLIAFNNASINAEERAREHATMFAFGVPVRTVLRLGMVESLLLAVAGTLVGLGLGVLVVQYMMRVLTPRVTPDLGAVASVSGATVVAAVALGVVAGTLATLLTTRRLRRMDVPATLRVME